jgi:subtilase family serine protease
MDCMMRRAAVTAGAVAIVGMCGAGGARAATSPATMSLPDSVAPAAAGHPGVGPVPAGRRETVELWMAGRRRAAQRFVDAVSTPGAPGYRRFVSPTAYTQRFGPRPSQVGAVRSFLSAQGFTQVTTSADDDYVSASAPASTVEHAFDVGMRRYRVGSDTFPANDRPLTVPTSIGHDILAVLGLNGARPRGAGGATRAHAARAHAAGSSAHCSAYWGQKTQVVDPAYHGITRAAVPVCGYSAAQMRAAYGLTRADTGKGKTIALVEVGGPSNMLQTLTDYARRNGLPAPRPEQYREEAIGQGVGNPKCGNEAFQESRTDSLAAFAVAPAANQLMVVGDDCDADDDDRGLFNAELAPLTGNGTSASVSVESVSYFLGREGQVPRSVQRASHAISLRAAAEGVSLIGISGDERGVFSPDDPDATVVGGTTLGVGAHDRRLFETGEADEVGERTDHSDAWVDHGIVGTGGGVSRVYGEPGYQKGVVPRTLSDEHPGHAGRTVPDLSADADFESGLLVGQILTTASGKTTSYEPFIGHGTSLSAPLVAGIVTDAEQGSRRNLGFLNPLLYSLAGTRAFHDLRPLSRSLPSTDRADVGRGAVLIKHTFTGGSLVYVLGSEGTGQTVGSGYDTVTGLGSPDGQAFIKALRSGGAHAKEPHHG